MVKLKNVQSRKGVGVFICWTDLVTVAQSGDRTMYRFGSSCNIVKLYSYEWYSGLNLNQYGVVSPCRTICTVCGFVALS